MDLRMFCIVSAFFLCYGCLSAHDHLLVKRQMPTMAPFPMNPFNQGIQQSASSMINKMQSNLNHNIFGLPAPSNTNPTPSFLLSTLPPATTTTIRPTRAAGATRGTRNTTGTTATVQTVTRGRRELPQDGLPAAESTTEFPEAGTTAEITLSESSTADPTSETEEASTAEPSAENSNGNDEELASGTTEETTTENSDDTPVVDIPDRSGFPNSFRASSFGPLTPNSLPLVLGSNIRINGAESRAVDPPRSVNVSVTVVNTTITPANASAVTGSFNGSRASSTALPARTAIQTTEGPIIVSQRRANVSGSLPTTSVPTSQRISTGLPFVFITNSTGSSEFPFAVDSTTNEPSSFEENDVDGLSNTTGSLRLGVTQEPITGVYPTNTTRLTVFNLFNRARNLTDPEVPTATETSTDIPTSFNETDTTDFSTSEEPFSASISDDFTGSINVTSDDLGLVNEEVSNTVATTTAFSREPITGLYPNTTRMTIFNLSQNSTEGANITGENSTSYESLFGVTEAQPANYSVPARRGHYVNGEWQWYDPEVLSNSTANSLLGNATLLSQLTQEDNDHLENETSSPIRNLTQSQIQQDLIDEDILTRPPIMPHNTTSSNAVNVSSTAYPNVDEDFNDMSSQNFSEAGTTEGSTTRATSTRSTVPPSEFFLAEYFDGNPSLPLFTHNRTTFSPIRSSSTPNTPVTTRRSSSWTSTSTGKASSSPSSQRTTRRTQATTARLASSSTTSRSTSSNARRSSVVQDEGAFAPWGWSLTESGEEANVTTRFTIRTTGTSRGSASTTKNAVTVTSTPVSRSSISTTGKSLSPFGQNGSALQSSSSSSSATSRSLPSTTQARKNLSSLSPPDQQSNSNSDGFSAQQSDDIELAQRSLLIPIVANGTEQGTEEKPQLELLAPPTVRPVPRYSATSSYVPADPVDEKRFWSIVPKPMNSAQVGKLQASTNRIKPYPTFEQPQRTSFSCRNVKPGWYADPETGCQGFTRCDIHGGQYKFVCAPGTLFSQITQVCDYWYNVDCLDQVRYADYINSRLYHNFGRNEQSAPAERSRPLLMSGNDGNHPSSTSLSPIKTNVSTTSAVSSTTVRPTASQAFTTTSSLPKIITASTRIPESVKPVNVTTASNLSTMNSSATSTTALPSTSAETTTRDTAGIEEP